MTGANVVSYKNMPIRLPYTSTAVAYLLLDKFNASGVVWGVVGCLYLIVWILLIIGKTVQVQKDVV